MRRMPVVLVIVVRCLQSPAAGGVRQVPSRVDTLAEGSQLVESDGYTFNIVLSKGEPGAPTVVLESGGGADSRQWAALQPRLAAETKAAVVSYDRPGFGRSPLPAKPYDITAETDAIRHALETAGLGRRVILVGSSYGGLLIQLWASRAPDTVAGLLFLDPNSPAAALPVRAFLPEPPMTNPKTPLQLAHARVEAAGDVRFAAVYAHPLPIQAPVIVVSAERPPFTDAHVLEVVRLSHELLAASVRNGKRVVAEGSGHNIPGDRPDLVIHYVKELISGFAAQK